MPILDLLRFVWCHPLNERAKLRALGRLLRWQFASRLMTGPIALPFVDSTHLFAVRGMTGATGNWYCGLHEVAEMGFVLHALRPGEHFLDVGANIGSYTVLAAGGVGARVTAVEPIPATHAALSLNVRLNGLEALVRLCPIGISDAATTLRFTAGLDTVNHVLAPGEDCPALEIPVLRLDDLLGDDVPVVIKVDVEGHELSVLKGGERTLADARLLAVLMETNGSGLRYGVGDDELKALMQHHGFGAFGYDPVARRLRPAIPGAANTLFIRDPEAVQRRVAEARRYRLVNGSI